MIAVACAPRSTALGCATMEELAATSDAELLSLHVAGDPHAFSLIVERHRDRLWAVALRTTGDPDDAADALQEALIRAFQRASQFRGESAVTTWLHRIVVNASLDRLRRKAVRATLSLPDADTKAGRALIDPTDHVGQREDQIAIASAEECKSQLGVAGKLGAIPRDESIRAIEDYSVVCRMLNRLIISRKSRGDKLE